MNKNSTPITLYPDVDLVLNDFAIRIQTILSSQFLGMYLYGSLALGDFNPQTSDIDFLVVTQADLSENLFNDLYGMHAAFDRSWSTWSRKIEAAYIPRQALKTDVSTVQYPQIEKGTELFRAPLEIGWPFQLYTLREKSVIVVGPVPRTFVDPVDKQAMQRSAAAIVDGWWDQAQQDPAWIAWARQRSSQAFVVLTLCRLLYSMEMESVASKPAAVRWAQENLDQRWNGLIQQALSGQHDARDISDDELSDMLSFLKYAAGRIHQ